MCSPPSWPLLNPVSFCCSTIDDSLRIVVSFTVLCAAILLSTVGGSTVLRNWANTVPKGLLFPNWIALCKWGFTVGLTWHSSSMGLYGSNGIQTQVWSGRASRQFQVTDLFTYYVSFFPNQVLMHTGPHMYWTLNKSTIPLCLAIVIIIRQITHWTLRVCQGLLYRNFMSRYLLLSPPFQMRKLRPRKFN